MEALGRGLGIVFIGIVTAFALTVLSTFLGGVAGWIVGLVFPIVTHTITTLAGVALTDFQLGATLGFFGSAFKSSLSTSS